MLPFLQDLSALYVVHRMIEHPLQKHSKHVNPIGLHWGCTFLLCVIQGRGPTWTGGGEWQASLWPSTRWRWVVGASWARRACHRTPTWGTAAWTLFLSPSATASTTSSTCLASRAKTPIRWGWLWFRLSQFCVLLILFPCYSLWELPWYNRTGWLGVKHQLTYSLWVFILSVLEMLWSTRQERIVQEKYCIKPKKVSCFVHLVRGNVYI